MSDLVANKFIELLGAQGIPADSNEGVFTIGPIGEGGFSMVLQRSANEYIVHFEGWHEHYATIDDALRCIAFGLTSDCRLKVDYRGKMPHKWSVQVWENNLWVTRSVVGLLFYPYWAKPRSEYFQNKIPSDTLAAIRLMLAAQLRI